MQRANRVDEFTMRLRETAPLGFDVQPGQTVEIKLEVDLPEGGKSESTVTVVLSNPVLEIESRIETIGPDNSIRIVSDVTATVDLFFEDDPAEEALKLTAGRGDLSYVDFTVEVQVPGGCSITTNTFEGTMHVIDGEVDFEDPSASGFGVPEDLVLAFEDIREELVITCPEGSSTLPMIHWFAGFVSFHGGQLGHPNEFDEARGGMVVTNWTAGSGDVFARRTYDRSGTAEEVQFKERTTMELKGPQYPPEQ